MMHGQKNIKLHILKFKKLVIQYLKNMIIYHKFKKKLICIQNGFIKFQIRSNSSGNVSCLNFDFSQLSSLWTLF